MTQTEDKMELSNSEKKAIVSQHIKGINTSIYNINISIISANALQEPDQELITNLNAQLSKEEQKKAALMNQYSLLNGQDKDKMTETSQQLVATISKEDKLSLIDARVRGIKIDKFNAELSIIEQNALEAPEESVVASANKIITRAIAQITALEAQYNSIQAE